MHHIVGLCLSSTISVSLKIPPRLEISRNVLASFLPVATVNLVRVSIIQLHFCQKVSLELLDSSIASMIPVLVMETAFGRPLSAYVNFFL